MAVKLNAGDVKRGDVFLVNPFEIEVKEDLRGRCTPPCEESVKDLAVSMLDYGQLQPVVARRVENHRLLLTAGFTRNAAARLIRTGFSHVDEAGQSQDYKDEEFRLKVTVSDCNDEEAFVRNVVENAHRKQTSPMDDAINQDKMRDRYGMTDVEIAKVYGWKSSVKVGRLHKLLQLEKDERALVHDGKMGVQGAIDLLDLPADQRKAAVEAATNDKGKVSGAKIVDAIRDSQLAGQDDAPLNLDPNDPFAQVLNDDGKAPANDEADQPEEDQKFRPRNRRQIVKFFTSEDYEHDPAVDRFRKDFVKYAEGKLTDKQMMNALYRLLNEDPAEDEDGKEAA